MFALVRDDVVVKYPYTLADLRRDRPGEEFPDDYDLSKAEGVLPVGESPVPKVEEGQTLDEDFPAWSNGKLVRKYLVHDWLTIEAGVNYVRLVGEVAHYPVTLADLRREKGSALSLPAGDSIQQMDGEWGMYPCEEVPSPDVPANRVVERIDAEEYAPLKFRQKYLLRDKTTEEFAEAKARKQAELRERRWMAEIGGTVIGGIPIRTDESSQNKIDGAISLFEKDPTLEVIDFEAQPGLWVELDRPAMTAIGVGVGRHIQACFSIQKPLSLAIEAAQSFADLAAIDIEAGWPS